VPARHIRAKGFKPSNIERTQGAVVSLHQFARNQAMTFGEQLKRNIDNGFGRPFPQLVQ